MIETPLRHVRITATGPLLVLLALAPHAPAPLAASASEPEAQQAEGASAEPAGATQDASATLIEDLAREAARAREFQARLAQFEADLAQAKAGERARASASMDRTASLAGDVQPAVAGSSQADALYQRIVDHLKDARPRLRSALDSLRDPPSVPRWTPALDTSRLQSPSISSRLAEIDALFAEIRETEARLRLEEEEQRWETVESRAVRVERLDDLRIECLTKLSRKGRSEILGFTRSGIAQLGREVDQLTLTFRLYLVTRSRNLHELPRLVRDIFVLGTATYSLLKIGLILAAFLFLRRRGGALLEGARRVVLQKRRGVRWTRRIETLLGAIQALAPWSLFLLTLGSLKWASGTAMRWPELGLPYRILVLYGLYRLARDGFVAMIVRVAHRYKLRLDAARTDKLIGSVRTIMRVFAGIAMLLALSEQFLGRGYLYHLVVNLAWVVVLAALLRVLAGWRAVIAEAYLAIGPSGRLEGLVRSTRGRWYGVFVAAASFAWLAGRAGLALARDFALGFDQTRKALAFLFRRRMEKQAERQGYSEGQVETLPPSLLKAFSEEAMPDGPLIVDHFPGLDRFAELFRAWTTGRTGGAFLLAGERGIGKTTWLGRVRTDGVPLTRLTLVRRALRVSDLASTLGPGLGKSAGSGAGLDLLRASLLDGPPRVVVLDQGENLFLGTVGGYDAFEEFVSLVESTCRNVFWLCSFTSSAFDHLSAVRPDVAVFRGRQILPAWNEAAIRSLIRARSAASQVEFTYEDLVVDRMEGISADARLLETEEGYTRLLWDYSDGNPRVSLHFWLRSLVPESPTRARVRLFRAPSLDALEDGGDAGLFVLAAIVLHENLTLPEAAAATRYPEALCRIHLERFLEAGALDLDRDRYRVTTHWHRAVVRLLRRKNLVSD